MSPLLLTNLAGISGPDNGEPQFSQKFESEGFLLSQDEQTILSPLSVVVCFFSFKGVVLFESVKLPGPIQPGAIESISNNELLYSIFHLKAG